MNGMVPVAYRVAARREDLRDTVTLTLEPESAPAATVEPGQFTMLYAAGIGEIAISVSGISPIQQTVRGVGAVSRALCALRPGASVGVRGPYGNGWDLGAARGRDLVFAGGGIGLAPLRSAVLAALEHPGRYGRINVLVGARTPEDLLYADELVDWARRGARVEVTVDRPAPGWTGHVGLITSLVALADVRPGETAAFVCGPEIMMRFTARALIERGLSDAAIQVSLERNMRCGIGWCGHCQLGPVLLCRDGPVLTYDRAAPLLAVSEL